MEEKVYLRPRFRKLADNEFMTFWNSLRDARKINKHGEFVLLRETEIYQQSQNFLLGNGVAGFAIKDDEMISVHKNNKKAEESGVKHILPKMVRCALKYNAKWGDCYGEFLANYYMKSGFIAVAKVKFDAIDEKNSPTWDYSTFGKPDIYLLMRGVKNIDELDRLKAKGEVQGFDAVEGLLPMFETYEEAENYRKNLYESVKKLGYKKRLEIVKNVKI